MSILQSDALNPGFSPRSIIRALWQRKIFIIVLWLLGSGATAAIVYHLRAVYRADALILAESQKIPENFVAPTVQTALETRLDRLKQQVLSRERLWSLIGEFNLYSKPRRTHTQDEVVEMMRKDIAIVLERSWSANRPGAFRVAYETFNPKTAADVTNRIARFFITENLREREVEAEGTSEFLDSQLAESKTQLQEQEAKLSQFKVAYNGELPEQQATLLAAVGQSRTELMGVQDGLARAQQNKMILDNSLQAAETNFQRLRDLARERAEQGASASVSLPGQPAPPTELELARAQLRALRLRYEDKYPEIQQLLFQIARLEREAREARIKAEQDAAAGPAQNPQSTVHGAVQDETLIAAKQQVEALKSQIALATREISHLEERRQRILQDVGNTQAHMQRLPIREQQLAAITRDYETSQANYRSLLDKKLAADVAQRMEERQKAERFVMLDAARIPEKPVRPKRALLSAIGALVWLLLAGALAFLNELRCNVVLGEWELPGGTVILGRVPRMAIEAVQS